jgi:photosynthetic reaction center cytochrome c subunit
LKKEESMSFETREFGWAIVVAIFLFPSATFSQTPLEHAMPSPDKKASEVFKNVQVLKDIPSDQLIPAMQFVTSSLGVQCSYCHVENAFDKDDKKTKQTARKMMRMMLDIDAANFEAKQVVTCNTCHRGNPRPLSIPSIPESQPRLLSEAEPPSQPNPPDLPRAEEIVAKYASAVGGEATIGKLKSLQEKGTFEAGGRQFPVEIFVQSPDHIAVVTHWPNGDSSATFDGRMGWITFPGRPQRMMSPADTDAARLDADLHFAIDVSKLFSELRVEKEAKVGGQDTVMISGERAGLPPVEMYFDKQSGLLTREVRYGQSPLGRNPTQIDYSDYRDVAGLKLPFHWISATPTGRFTIQLESAEANQAIPASKFEKPTPDPQ